MWEIGEIKERGRAAFKLNYWKCVVVSFILGFVMSGTSSVSTSSLRNNEQVQDSVSQMTDAYNGLTPGQRIAVIAAISGVITFIVAISFVVRIFVYNPLKVGGLAFFKRNVMAPPADLNEISEGFKNYLHIFATLFLSDLFLALWFMLFLIPGFIKSYSYRMVPYILADEPDLSPTETITRSRQMMDGHKWHAFCYDLSFIGWWILTILTCGLVGLFWFSPYKNSSDAALYLAIRGNMEPDYNADVPPVYTEPEQLDQPEATVNTEAVPEAAPEAVAEAVPEIAPEAAPVAAPEAAAEAAPEAAAEAAPEAAPESAPEDTKQKDEQ